MGTKKGKKKGKKKTQKEKTETVSQWIEELPIEELKLEYNHFRVAYKEFKVLNELTVTVLQDMGIFLKQAPKISKNSLLVDYDEEYDNEDKEQEMTDGIYDNQDDEVVDVNNSNIQYDQYTPRGLSPDKNAPPYESIMLDENTIGKRL